MELKESKVAKYLEITRKALKKGKIAVPKGTSLYELSEKYMDMAQRYYRDAKHFYEKKDYINAFAAVNYAHGWLDAGASTGLFDVDHDSKLFTVD